MSDEKQQAAKQMARFLERIERTRLQFVEEDRDKQFIRVALTHEFFESAVAALEAWRRAQVDVGFGVARSESTQEQELMLVDDPLDWAVIDRIEENWKRLETSIPKASL